MGLCGGSVSDIPLPRNIVIPKVDDCITLLMHTDDRWYANLKKCGHLYLTCAENSASLINCPLAFVPGSNIILEKLVSGRWDSQFIIASAGDVLHKEDFNI